MRHVAALSWARAEDAENEDEMVVGDGIAVVVDGAGLPPSMRAGCSHTVAWFARSIAAAFHHALASRTGSMKDALAVAIVRVAETHSDVCDLAAGSPSATVAAWRRSEHCLEYLVLCDASVILIDRHGHPTAITDERLEDANRAARAELTFEHPTAPIADTRTAARLQVEALRNREGGFWCVNSDPAAATEAITGEIDLDDVSGVIACSDGATRAYDLLSSHTLDQFALDCLAGALESLATAVRQTEDIQARTLEERGMKVHDDLTIVAAMRA